MDGISFQRIKEIGLFLIRNISDGKGTWGIGLFRSVETHYAPAVQQNRNDGFADKMMKLADAAQDGDRSQRLQRKSA